MNKTIIFVGGGSLGHVSKHLAVYPYIKNDFDRALFIGSEGGVEKEYLQNKFPFEALPVARLDRAHVTKNLILPIDLFKAIKKAKAILKREEPSVVFCGGGFTGLPVSIAAKRLGIPVVLHESDYSPGLANKLSLPFCEKILTTFEDTLKNSKKAVCCGAPIRRELFSANKETAFKKFGFTANKRVLLVIGGSKGSRIINENFERIYEKLFTRFSVIHICGKDNYRPSNKSGYVKLPFTNDMASVYAASDLAISRCGANTAFELVAMNIPSLFIPLSKKASRGDQIQNADYFLKRDLCRVLPEEELTPERLLKEIDNLEKSAELLKKNMKAFSITDTDRKIADILRSYAKN